MSMNIGSPSENLVGEEEKGSEKVVVDLPDLEEEEGNPPFAIQIKFCLPSQKCISCVGGWQENVSGYFLYILW